MENLQQVFEMYRGAKRYELSESTLDTLEDAVTLALHPESPLARYSDEEIAHLETTLRPEERARLRQQQWRRPLSAIDRVAVDRWKNWVVAGGGRPRGANGEPRPRKRNTANMYLRSLRAMLNYATAEEVGWVRRNPFRGVKPFAVTPRPVTTYEDWQFLAMLQHLPKPTAADPLRDIRWLAILWGGRTTGFRKGAILNLTWSNIRNGMVWAEPKEATSDTWPWEPKTRRNYRVPLAPQFAEALEPFKDRLYPLVAPRMYAWMLAHQQAGQLPWRYRKCPEWSFGRTFQRIQKRTFGQQIGDFHQLRRTYIDSLAPYLPDKALMELSNHTRRATLDPYTAVRGSHFQIAYEQMKAIGKRPPYGLQVPGDTGFAYRP